MDWGIVVSALVANLILLLSVAAIGILFFGLAARGIKKEMKAGTCWRGFCGLAAGRGASIYGVSAYRSLTRSSAEESCSPCTTTPLVRSLERCGWCFGSKDWSLNPSTPWL